MLHTKSERELACECLLKGFHPKSYRISELISKGNFGVVSRLTKVESDTDDLPSYIALKSIRIGNNHDGVREYQILKRCSHANILKLFYWEIVKVKHDVNHMKLYSELCDFNLRGFLDKYGSSDGIIKTLCRQMIAGCHYLHSMNIVHRDIKPENILVNCKNEINPTDVVIKIADFGLARFLPSEISSSFQQTACGTRAYSAPEVFCAMDKKSLMETAFPFAADVFSLGVVIFEMITNKSPFRLTDLLQPSFHVERIVGKYVHIPEFRTGLSQMLQWNCKIRPKSEDLLELLEVTLSIFIFISYVYEYFIQTASAISSWFTEEKLGMSIEEAICQLKMNNVSEDHHEDTDLLNISTFSPVIQKLLTKLIEGWNGLTLHEDDDSILLQPWERLNRILANNKKFAEFLQRGDICYLEMEHFLSNIADEEIKVEVINWTNHFNPSGDSISAPKVPVTPLMWTVVKGHTKLTELLLQNSCDMNAQDDGQHRTALHCAAESGNTVMVNLLLDHGCDVEIEDRIGYTALHIAAEKGHAEVMRLLMQNNADLNKAAYYDRGQTALHKAASKGNANVVSCLLESQKCDLNLQDASGWTALHLASYNGYLDVVNILMLNQECHREVRNSKGNTALLLAVEGGHFKVVEKLVREGVDVNAEDNEGKNSLYLSALDNGENYITIRSLLMKHSAEISEKQFNLAIGRPINRVLANLRPYFKTNFEHWMKLIVKDSSHSYKRLEYLKYQVDITKLTRFIAQEDGGRDTILGLACKNNLLPVVEYLVNECSADVNKGTPTPLWHAANERQKKVVEYLVQKSDVDFHIEAPDGTTPLVVVIKKGYSELLTCFKRQFDGDGFGIMKECIKHGKVPMLLRAETELNEERTSELMEEALKSGCEDTIDYVEFLTESIL